MARCWPSMNFVRAVVMAAGGEIAHCEVDEFDFHRPQVILGSNCLVVGDFDKTHDAA